MSFISDINEKVLIFDGSMGVMLQRNGLPSGVCPEEWNLSHPDVVKGIYTAYKQAGSNVIQTNTFQSNHMKLQEYGLSDKHYEINFQSVRLAKEVMGDEGYVAASIGPLGKLLEPFGALTFQEAYDTFKAQVEAVRDGGADIISFETFTDVAEMRIALLAAKENCELPVICSISYEQNGRTLMGSAPEICAIILYSMGADLIGTNCSFGAGHMLKIAEVYASTGLNFSMKPNAGLPETIDGKQVYTETPEGFASHALDFVKLGAVLVGGCCGTNPEFIARIAANVGASSPVNHPVDLDYITSSTIKVAYGDIKSAQIGRIDIHGDSPLKNSLESGDTGDITDIVMDMLEEDYDIILVNVDYEGADAEVLSHVVKEAQTYLKQPFVLMSSNKSALESALRIYKGRAGVITDSSEETAAMLKKYGAVQVRSFLPDEK